MKIIYRLSDGGYAKEKAPYINNINCLSNLLSTFGYDNEHKNIDIHIICDNVRDSTFNEIRELYQENKFLEVTPTIERTNLGSGAQSFNHALDIALTYDDNEVVYFVEDDYLHRYGWDLIMNEAFDELDANYVTMYDHPDKYLDPSRGGNPQVSGGGEVTRVFLTESSHWKLTNSTTMTFAAKVKTLREDENILREFTLGTYPRDFDMFLKLRENNRTLVSPIPGAATHGETAWLSPILDWEMIARTENLQTVLNRNMGIV